MRAMRTAAPSAPAKESRFDPATWAQQARLLARAEAEAAALQVSLALAVLAMLWIGAVLALDALAPRDPATVAGLAVGAVLVVLVVYVWVYSSALAANTHEVRRATWQREREMGEDIDGDGVVGEPEPVGHVVRIGGSAPRDVVLPNLDVATRAARPLARFPVAPNDVIYVLTRAASAGLGFREWEGHRLPSGAEIDRLLWGRIIDGMVDWEMVQATTDAAGRRRVRLAGDVSVDEMIAAVRQSVAGVKP